MIVLPQDQISITVIMKAQDIMMDSSDWVRKIVMERELADIESSFSHSIKELKTYEESRAANEEFIKKTYVCEYLRDIIKEMENTF